MHRTPFKILTIIFLSVLLISCNQSMPSQISNNSSVTTQPTMTILQSTASTSKVDTPNKIRFNISNLHIDSTIFDCGNYDETIKQNPLGNLVLKYSRLKYDPIELQQMKAYVRAYYFRDPYSDKPLPALPDTLSWIPGSTNPELGPTDFYSAGCYGEITVTNVGDTTLKIRSIDIRLLTFPQKNETRYRMVDLCSFIDKSIDNCPPGAAGANENCYYFLLHIASIDTIFNPTQPPFNCLPNLSNGILHPGDIDYFSVFIGTTPDNIIYSVIPELVIDTSSGSRTISLPQLANKLYFASPLQFSCYTLEGSTFVATTANLPNNLCL